MDQIGQHTGMDHLVQVVNTTLNAATVVLCAWLANRRRKADRTQNALRCAECREVEAALRRRADVYRRGNGVDGP